MTNTADLEQKLRTYADQIRRAREGQYKHMGFSEEGERVFAEAADALASLSRRLEEAERESFEQGARWMRKRAAKLASQARDPIEGDAIAAAIRALTVEKQARLSTADVAREPADKGSEGL